MIFNRELLFLHVPKTAGKSIAQSLTATLARPLWAYVPVGTERSLRTIPGVDEDGGGVTFERSSGHEGVSKAFQTMTEVGLDPRRLQLIMFVIRRPYDLMVSNYHFMREQYGNNVGRPNFELAKDLEFEDWAEQVSFADMSRYFLVHQRTRPRQLRVLRYERLADDYAEAMASIGYEPTPLPHLNASTHPDAEDLLTPRAEAAVYRKFQYLFDEGYYERLQLGAQA